MRSFDRVKYTGELAGAHRVADVDGGLEDAGKRGVGEGIPALDPHEADRRGRLPVGIGQDAD